ncbi:MAG: malectin domain-containing carbohydrate-binding protein [Candidatus Acidiferrales bacterium]
MESTVSNFEAERAELDSLLNSETFGRGNNAAKILSFVCDKYFQGCTGEVKEYDIAIHALGRPKDFDPQIDAIVRVTAHALRKRLEQFYRSEGAEHSVQIYLPSGHYVPKFVRKSELKTEELQLGPKETIETRAVPGNSMPAAGILLTPPSEKTPAETSEPRVALRESIARDARTAQVRRFRTWKVLAVVFVFLCVLVVVASYVRIRARNNEAVAVSDSVFPIPASVPGDTVRAMVGDTRAPYTDRAGQVWGSDTYCTGGVSFSVPAVPILATFDTQLYLGGRSGLFHCAFPMPTGTYEVHLLFAETTSVEETGRTVDFSLNGGPTNGLDVVDDAGANDTATEKVFTNVRPEQDGKIHLDFTSNQSYLNAVEILPGIPNRMLPVRIYAGETPYRDSTGNVWLPNRFYFGGRESHYQVVDAASILDGGLYTSQWIGHFRYVIPVAAGEKYTLKLYFRESYFGGQDGGGGVVGSRVFDVWCNGSVILKHFDILREAGSAPLIKTFAHIEPTGQNKIEINFVPVVNYPSLNAIEVIPE